MENATHGVIALQAGFKLILFDADFADHVSRPRPCSPAQFRQFIQLLAQAGEGGNQQAARMTADIAQFALGVLLTMLRLAGISSLDKAVSSSGKPALGLQRLIAIDLGHQTLVCRNGENLRCGSSRISAQASA